VGSTVALSGFVTIPLLILDFAFQSKIMAGLTAAAIKV
jgi:ABC-type glycerol-3-phosphate transport system permease component